MDLSVASLRAMLPRFRQGVGFFPQEHVTPTWGVGHLTSYSPLTKIGTEDHFVGPGIFLKRVYRTDIPKSERKVILAMPGNWSNGNYFRVSLGDGNFKEPIHLDSFDNYAASRGYDVWIFHGFNPRVWSRYVERKLGKHCPVSLKDISFEKTLGMDLPQVIDYICKIAGTDILGMLGHSKGGLLDLAYAGTTQDPRIRAIQTIASGITFSEEQRSIQLGALISILYFSLGFKELNPIQLMSSSVIRLTKLMPDNQVVLDKLPFLWNPKNMGARAGRFMIDKVSEPLSLSEFWFFVQMILTGDFKSLPQGKYEELNLFGLIREVLERRGLPTFPRFAFGPDTRTDFKSVLGNIHVPVQVFSGGKDRIFPTETVSPILDAVGSQIKYLVEDPIAGHVDIWAGKHSMANWIKALDFFDQHLK